MNVPPSWSLNDLYKGKDDPELKNDLDKLKNRAEKFQKNYTGKLKGISPEKFAIALSEYESISELDGKISSYARLLSCENLSNEENARFAQRIREISAECGTNILFFTLEINSLSEDEINYLLKDKAVEHYRPYIENVRLFKPHDLSNQVEQILMEKDTVSYAAFVRVYDETVAAMRVPLNGENVTLTKALDSFFSPDRELRKQAGSRICETLNKDLPLISIIYNTLMKDKQLEDKWRHYKTPADFRHLSNRLEPEVVNAMAEAIEESYPETSHRYYAYKAKQLGLKNLAHYDRNAPIFPDITDKTYSWNDAVQIVLNAYKNFSPVFYETALPFFQNGWVDAIPRDGKAQGAFAHSTVPSAHPYLLMSFLGKTRDVITLAHELGHGIHQRLAAKNGYLQMHAPLTFAETASVFGEMLVFRSLLDNENDVRRKKMMIAQKTEDMINTVVRQNAFFRFETIAHDKRKKGELSKEELCQIWQTVQKESLGNAFDFDAEYDPYWSYISHFFHSPFYVYAYAFADCLVNSLYSVYQETANKKDFVEKYTEMLASGGTKTYRELLKPFGLDATDKSFWKKGLSILKSFIDELEST